MRFLTGVVKRKRSVDHVFAAKPNETIKGTSYEAVSEVSDVYSFWES